MQPSFTNSVTLLFCLCMAWMQAGAEQVPTDTDLDGLGSQSLAVLDTAYRQPRPEFVCGSDAELGYPKEFRRRPQAAVVDLEFTRTAQGYARDFYVTRETHPAFGREAIHYLRQCRFAPQAANLYGQNIRVLYQRSSTERGTTLYLRKLKRSARKGTPGRKRFYAYNLELATSFDKIPRDAEANRWYLKAAVLGDAKAQYQVGLRLLYGQGFDQRSKLGMRWLLQAAAGGSGGANFALAQTLEPTPDSGVQQRLDYLRAATKAGHTGAALALARGLLAQAASEDSAELDPTNLAEVAELLTLSEDAWDKERWLLVAARYALAIGDLEAAAGHVAAAQQYVADIGHPMNEVEQLARELLKAQGAAI